MYFVKPSAIGLRIVEGREGNVDIANIACLGSDLVKEWGDVGAVRSRRCRGEYFRELEAIVEIE